MYMRIFVVLLRLFEFHTFPIACHAPLAIPILPFHILVRPLPCSLPDTRSLPFAPVPVLPPPVEISCFPLLRIGVLSYACISSYPLFNSPALLLLAPFAMPLPVLPVGQYHAQISYLLFFHLRCQPLLLIHASSGHNHFQEYVEKQR